VVSSIERVFLGSFIATISQQHTILISTLKLRIDTSDCSMMGKHYVRCHLKPHSNKSHHLLDFCLLDTGLQIDCPAPSAHTLGDLDTCCGERGSNNGMCFNSLLGWMTGNTLMTNISTQLVFMILWHYGGSGVVLQNCCGQIT